ncbi:MAG: helix-turn-helix domain-containing protein [Sideroxydans sp.]
MSSEPETPSMPGAPAATLASVGAALRAERERQGLSIEEMAARIKFAPRQLLALEAGEPAALPKGTFLRGMVRSYAHSLHLDEAPLLANLQAPDNAHGDVRAVQAGDTEFPRTSQTVRLNRYLYGAAAMLVALGVFWTASRPPVAEQTVMQDIALAPEQPASAVVALSSSAPVVAPPEAEAARPSAASEVPTSPELSVSPVSAVAAAKPVVTEEQLRKRPIHLVFTADSWAEIRDVNGELLLSRMNPAGSEKWIGGLRRAPYQITIGRPDAVKLFYRGREINLSQYQATNGVVRFTLE